MSELWSTSSENENANKMRTYENGLEWELLIFVDIFSNVIDYFVSWWVLWIYLEKNADAGK